MVSKPYCTFLHHDRLSRRHVELAVRHFKPTDHVSGPSEEKVRIPPLTEHPVRGGPSGTRGPPNMSVRRRKKWFVSRRLRNIQFAAGRPVY
ncbi:hypothetical protein TNCV_557611 [Trichonephila clavipes]|nr:hypothetical protein TNCV_557611 [Trichonephila clavipes]